jgi:hypothetical protein
MLFGVEWQHAVARALGPFHPDGPREAIDGRLVRRWASGERVVPNWVISALAKMLELRERETSAMRVRVSRVALALDAEVAEFSVEIRHQQIWAEHKPSGESFGFVLLTGCNQVGALHTHAAARHDPDDPVIDVITESARQAARQSLSTRP